MQGRGLNESKQKIGSISKNKNVCFIIKDNKIRKYKYKKNYKA